MTPELKKLIIAILLAIVAFLSGAGVQEAVDDDTKEPTKKEEPQASATPTAAPVGDLQVEPEAPSKPGDPETSLRDETPDEVPTEVLEEGQEAAERLAGTELGDPLPVGGAQNYVLRKKFDCHVYSDRQYPAVQFVLHFTVSPNRAGWGDVYGIHDYFCRTKIASSTYIQDFECNTLQMVPESKKPWTQGAFNSSSISVEIIATGSETRQQWLDSDLISKGCLADLARDSMRRNGIRILRVDPVGCTPKVGYTDHNALECGNDHTDVGRNFPWDKFTDQVRGPIKPLCGDTCQGVKRRHRVTHRKIEAEKCRPLGKTRRPLCTNLREREQKQHERLRRVWKVRVH